MRAMIMTASLVALMACQTQIPEEETTVQVCIADELQAFVGQPVSAMSLDNLPEPVRVIAPDTAVTMDYREDRLNIEHDDGQIITRIYCG
jgi:hypothetical protein